MAEVSSTRADSGRPNLVVIMSDQHAAGALGCYGNRTVRTPNIDRLAADGVRFDNAYCNNPVCVPSRMSMLTGLLSSRINVWNNADCLSPHFATWPLLLRYAGYETVISGRNHMLWGDRLYGFGRRLCGDTGNVIPFIEPGRTQQGDPRRMPQGVDTCLGARPQSPHARHDAEAAARAIEYLAAPRESPFALFVGFYQPHAPFAALPEYFNLYAGQDMPTKLPPHANVALYKTQETERELTADTLQTIARGYYGMISHVDQLTGDIVSALERHGLRDNTVVLYTSDHGEMLGAHGLWHKMVFYEEAVRVPLVFSAPARWKGGRTSPQNVSLVDLFPTFLELGECEADLPLDGHSLLPLLHGNSNHWDNAVLAETIGIRRGEPGRMLKRDDLKLLMYHRRPPVLFDLQTDSGEETDVAGNPAYASRLAELTAEAAREWNPDAVAAAVESQLRNIFYHHEVTRNDALRADKPKG